MDLTDLKQAALEGDMFEQYALGVMYELGIKTTADHIEAMKWYAMAAQQGHSTAWCMLNNLKQKL